MLKPPKRRLIEQLYKAASPTHDGNLDADVRTWIADRRTWRDMAELVSARCEYEISYESLRRWYHAEAEEFAAASRAAKAKANTQLGFDVSDKQPA